MLIDPRPFPANVTYTKTQKGVRDEKSYKQDHLDSSDRVVSSRMQHYYFLSPINTNVFTHSASRKISSNLDVSAYPS